MPIICGSVICEASSIIARLKLLSLTRFMFALREDVVATVIRAFFIMSRTSATLEQAFTRSDSSRLW